jgi:hypothetical protein
VVESRRIPNISHTLKRLRDVLIAGAPAVPMLVNKVGHIGKGWIGGILRREQRPSSLEIGYGDW